MTDSHDRTQELFAGVLAQPPAERQRWLAAASRGDAALLARVCQLVEAHERAGSFLADPGAEVRLAAQAGGGEQPGETIGGYKLLERIGEGGFGTVWMAEQRTPVRRLVALKVLKPGMDSRQVVARFEQERQALALMQHPNVAQVFDAGTTERGRPFFVMELVKGVPITDYCARDKLPVRARLALFVQVCRAVQHAHGKGLIHRDIKPRNVLVATADGKPLAKVIDFGIAKATGARLTEQTLWTEHRAMIGTLEYMSPEQAEGLLDVDTRTDVYSLGALLYELLTGGTPFDGRELMARGYAEIVRALREVEPPRPSVRVSGHQAAGWAGNGGAARDAKDLFGVLRGDLDWVVMKALEKDRGRRYATADGLADDVERYLGGEAVRAVPPSVGYRVRKFVRRNRGLVVGGLAVGASMLAGIVGTTLGMQSAQRHAERMRVLSETAVATLSDAVGGGNKMGITVREKHGHPLPGTGIEQNQAVVEVVLEGLLEQVRDQVRTAELAAYRANLNATNAYAMSGASSLAHESHGRCREELRGWEWRYVGAASGELPRVLLPRFRAWDLSPDQSRLAVIDDRNQLSVFDTTTWTRSVPCALTVDDVKTVAIAADDHVLVGTAKSVVLMRLPACAPVRVLNVPGDRVSRASPNLRVFAHLEDDQSAANDDRVTFWDVASGRVLVEARLPDANAPSYSFDGRFAACCGRDRTLVWRLGDGQPVLDVQDMLELNPFGPLSCSRRGHVVDPAAGSIRAWHAAEATVTGYFDADHVLCERGESPTTLEIRRILDGTTTQDLGRRPTLGLCVVTPDRTRLYGHWVECLWGSSLVTGATLPDEPFMWWQNLALAAAGRWWIGEDSSGRLTAMGARPPCYTDPGTEPLLALGTASDPAGPRTIGRSISHVHVFDECSAAYTSNAAAEPEVVAAASSSDGRRFLLRSATGLAVVDAQSSQRLAALADPGDVRELALSHDGALAAACDPTAVRVWDAASGATRHTLPVPGLPTGDTRVLAVHSGWVALGSGNTLRLLPTAGAAPASEHALAGTVTALLFPPDGSRLLVGTSSGQASILTVPGLERCATLDGHVGPVLALAWCPAGDRAFTAGADGTLRVWLAQPDIPTDAGVELLSLSEPNITGKPKCILFPPDGERLICGYDDGAIRVWDAVPWRERVDRRNAAAPKARLR